MGSPGSERTYCQGTRLTVEDALSLSISTLRRRGLLSDRGGRQRFPWNNEQGEVIASIDVVVDMTSRPSPIVRLQYIASVDGTRHRIDLPVALTSSLLHHRGHRWWFSCPACGRRVGVLHLPPGEVFFACRACHDLSYRSRWRGHRDTIER